MRGLPLRKPEITTDPSSPIIYKFLIDELLNQPSLAEPMDAADKIKALIAEDGRPITEIAALSGVPYMGLYMWVRGTQKSYDVRLAERVYKALTGKDLTP